MKKMDFAKGVAALKKLTADDVRVITGMIVLHDETSAVEDQSILNMNYGFLKEPGGEKVSDAANGSVCISDMPLIESNDNDIEYIDGMPCIMLYHYRVKELAGVEENSSVECATPVLTLKKKDGTSVFLGEKGYLHGQCTDCEFGKIGEKKRSCLPVTKFAVITVYPKADGEYGYCIVQFKGRGMRAKPLQNAMTKLTAETGGVKYNKILKLHSQKSEPFKVVNEAGKEVSKTVYVYTFNVVERLPENIEMKTAQSELREQLGLYLVDQHWYRTALADERKKVNMLENRTAPDEGRMIENKGGIPGTGETPALASPKEEDLVL